MIVHALAIGQYCCRGSGLIGGTVSADSRPSLIFSVDVEDWAQSTLDPNLPIGEQCAANARRMIEIVGEIPGATGTFFVLGKFAEKHPAVVRELHSAGHEVACHGYGHVQLHLLDADRFREDLRRAVGIIGNLIGEGLRGYRAPVFSIGAGNLWALDVLAEEGFAYDSSIFPIAGSRYGIPDWPHETCNVRLANDRAIVEFPLTAKRALGRNIPISGGGYARLFPGWLLRRLLHGETMRRSTWPVFYCHPYEIDPDEFRRSSPSPPWGDLVLPLKLRLHQGLGRRGFAHKVRLLGKHFRFRSFADALASGSNFGEIRAADFTV